ncbi:sulfopyruvate decarboxylase subunit alpha [SAR202 cluster bacterium AD-493-K16_JPT_193m]|nr:sulfopyruvate decarboxylase subunit alpha [SAR202 cluster bacterium AD-493-K16_JPT_193m]
MTIPSTEFWKALKCRGFAFFAGVPDSTFGSAYKDLLDDTEIKYVPAVREDVALGVVSAAALSGKNGAVVMQNSGVGNIINPLTSFNLLYKVPALLIIGWRGFGGAPNDAPEHWIMGEKTPEMLLTLDMPVEQLEIEDWETILARLIDAIQEKSVPGALLVRAGLLS